MGQRAPKLVETAPWPGPVDVENPDRAVSQGFVADGDPEAVQGPPVDVIAVIPVATARLGELLDAFEQRVEFEEGRAGRGGQSRPESQGLSSDEVGADVRLGEHGIGVQTHLGPEEDPSGDVEVGHVEGVAVASHVTNQAAWGREPKLSDAMLDGQASQLVGVRRHERPARRRQLGFDVRSAHAAIVGRCVSSSRRNLGTQ